MTLRTYFLACRKHTNNIASRKVTMTNTVIKLLKTKYLMLVVLL